MSRKQMRSISTIYHCILNLSEAGYWRVFRWCEPLVSDDGKLTLTYINQQKLGWTRHRLQASTAVQKTELSINTRSLLWTYQKLDLRYMNHPNYKIIFCVLSPRFEQEQLKSFTTVKLLIEDFISFYIRFDSLETSIIAIYLVINCGLHHWMQQLGLANESCL